MNWFLVKSQSGSYTEALQMYKEARAPRDYKREYAQYHSKPQRVAERSQRNQARRKLGLRKGDPREVDHKNPISNGGSNARSNLRAVSLVENRKKFTKTANDNISHTIVTGHSGAGKTTLSKRLAKEKGIPHISMDWTPEMKKYQQDYARDNDGRLDLSPERSAFERKYQRDTLMKALKRRTPSVLEGTYISQVRPDELKGHRLILVDPDHDRIINQRMARKKQKDISRGRGWDKQREKENIERGRSLIALHEPDMEHWRNSSLVEKRASAKHHITKLKNKR